MERRAYCNFSNDEQPNLIEIFKAMAELDIEATVNLMVVSPCLSARYPEVPRYSADTNR